MRYQVVHGFKSAKANVTNQTLVIIGFVLTDDNLFLVPQEMFAPVAVRVEGGMARVASVFIGVALKVLFNILLVQRLEITVRRGVNQNILVAEHV